MKINDIKPPDILTRGNTKPIIIHNNYYYTIGSANPKPDGDSIIIGDIKFSICRGESIATIEKNFFSRHTNDLHDLCTQHEKFREYLQLKKQIEQNYLYAYMLREIIPFSDPSKRKRNISDEELAEYSNESGFVMGLFSPLALFAVLFEISHTLGTDLLEYIKQHGEPPQDQIVQLDEFGVELEEYTRAQHADNIRQQAQETLIRDLPKLEDLSSLDNMLGLDKLAYPLLNAVVPTDLLVMGGIANHKVWRLIQNNTPQRTSVMLDGNCYVPTPFDTWSHISDRYMAFLQTIINDRARIAEQKAKELKARTAYGESEMSCLLNKRDKIANKSDDIGWILYPNENKIFIYMNIPPTIITTIDGKYVPLPQKFKSGELGTDSERYEFIPNPPQDIPLGFDLWIDDSKTIRRDWLKVGVSKYPPKNIRFPAEHHTTGELCAPPLKDVYQLEDSVEALRRGICSILEGWVPPEQHRPFVRYINQFEAISLEKALELKQKNTYNFPQGVYNVRYDR